MPRYITLFFYMQYLPSPIVVVNKRVLFFRFNAPSLSLKDESRLGLESEYFDIGTEVVLLDGDSTVSLALQNSNERPM